MFCGLQKSVLSNCMRRVLNIFSWTYPFRGQNTPSERMLNDLIWKLSSSMTLWCWDCGDVSINICTFPKQNTTFTCRVLYSVTLKILYCIYFQPCHQWSWVLLSLFLTNYASFPSYYIKKMCCPPQVSSPNFFPVSTIQRHTSDRAYAACYVEWPKTPHIWSSTLLLWAHSPWEGRLRVQVLLASVDQAVCNFLKSSQSLLHASFD